jgi:hypothetical protein
MKVPYVAASRVLTERVGNYTGIIFFRDPFSRFFSDVNHR